MAKPNAFLNEVIATFADMDGVIPLCRGDAFTLYLEAGYSRREADCLAFASYVRPIAAEPWSAADARAELIADGIIEQRRAA